MLPADLLQINAKMSIHLIFLWIPQNQRQIEPFVWILTWYCMHVYNDQENREIVITFNDIDHLIMQLVKIWFTFAQYTYVFCIKFIEFW